MTHHQFSVLWFLIAAVVIAINSVGAAVRGETQRSVVLMRLAAGACLLAGIGALSS